MQIYLHIPFCSSKCPYCAFKSTQDKSLQKAYEKAFLYELKTSLKQAYLKQISDKKSKISQSKKNNFKQNFLTSVFIGGGTPSVMGIDFYEKVFSRLNPYLNKNCEITTEANPNSANLSWLKGMKNLGVNRLSLGVQSFDDDKLKFLGRTHLGKDAYKAIQNALLAGFININADFIISCKGDSKDLLDKDLQKAASLKLSHISAYELTIEKNTPFAKHENYALKDEALLKYFAKKLEENGYPQYEVSNFGKVCKHNLGYWQGKDYLGIGLGGVGCVGGIRTYSKDDLSEYIKNPLQKRYEFLSKNDKSLEALFLGFRSCVGVLRSNLNQKSLKKARILQNEGKLISSKQRGFKGWFEHKFGFNCEKIIRTNKERFFAKDFFLADEIALYLE